MPCTLSRTQSDISGISGRGKASLPLKSLEQHNTATSEDCAESPVPVIWQNIQNRCAFLTFLTLEADGNWKILAVPVQCSENTNHSTRRCQYTGRSPSGSRVRSQPRNRAICNSDFLPESDNKAESTVRTCTSKKSRKKGKQGKKSPLNGVSAGISPLPPHQSDIQENFNGARDIPEDTAASSDQKVPEKCPIFGPEDQLRTHESRLCDSSSSNASIGSDGHESLKVDSGASDIEGGEMRCKEPLNSNPSQRVLNDVVDIADQGEQTRRNNTKNAAKKSSRVKTVVNSPSASRSGNLGNSRSYNTDKENSHPVWQKVRRKVGSEGDLMMVNHKLVQTNEAPKDEDKKQPPAKESGKVKRKHCPSFKQESNRYSKKGSSPNKSKLGSSNKSAHSNIISISEVASPSVSPRDKLRTDEAGCLNPEPVEDGEGLQLCGDNSSSIANSYTEHMEDLDSSSGESRFDPKIPNIMSSPLCLPHPLANGVACSGKEDVFSGSCGQRSTSGSVAQKWVPVGTKIVSSTGLSSKSCISVEHFQAEACQEQTPSVNSESTIPLLISEVENSCSPSEEEGQTDSTANHMSGVPEDQNDGVASNSSVISRLKVQCQTDLDRLARAIDNAHRAQLASEAIHRASGAPVAEFERLLHLSCPVLCLSHSITSKMCPRNHLDLSLCLHETPGVPLGCLWQWYQKHGSFGLEIRGKDYNNSKRLGIDRFSFRAYFVPYLSAVQLFRAGKKQMPKSSTGDPDPETYGKTVGHLPIFPLLVPGACKHTVASQTAESAECDESELIFEYFELEQPQQRQPLYEKIQELVRGDGPSRDKAYGDPAALNSVNLQDLDPRSWYSVAWYPIYRIPDGSFRAAFLTYHSLGHFVRRNGLDNSVVSPVVGLQSYNAQSECWFKLNPSVTNQKSHFPSLDPSKILAERLGTLEEAASLMSRASVRKGNGLPTVNNHPDFEFFLSRRRYY